VKHDLPLVVDFHVHMLEEGVFRASTNKTVVHRLRRESNARARRARYSLCTHVRPETGIEDMDARGIDIAL